MPEHDFKKGDPVEAVKMRRGKQTIPAGTKGKIIDVNPQIAELIWVRTDEPVSAPIGNKTGTKIIGETMRQDFWVCAEEIKKI